MIHIDRKDFSKLKDGTLMKLSYYSNNELSNFIVEKRGKMFIFHTEEMCSSVQEYYVNLGYMDNKYYVMENDEELNEITEMLISWRYYD